jgi:hypothetical protein
MAIRMEAGANRAPICGMPAGGLAAFDPAPEELDLLLRPGDVAGHGSVFEAAEDGVGVLADVVVRPEIEGPLHRCTVALTEQRPDLSLEAHRLVNVGAHRSHRTTA